jgi:hypothetical protein
MLASDSRRFNCHIYQSSIGGSTEEYGLGPNSSISPAASTRFSDCRRPPCKREECNLRLGPRAATLCIRTLRARPIWRKHWLQHDRIGEHETGMRLQPRFWRSHKALSEHPVGSVQANLDVLFRERHATCKDFVSFVTHGRPRRKTERSAECHTCLANKLFFCDR